MNIIDSVSLLYEFFPWNVLLQEVISHYKNNKNKNDKRI